MSNRNKSTSQFGMMPLAMLFLCLMTISSNAYPLSRPRSQRQTVLNELTTDVTNSGTSFQSFGSKTNYIPQEDYCARGVGGHRGVNDYPGYVGYGDAAPDKNNYGPQGWRGFGIGKNPYGVRPHQTPYGNKY